MNRLASSLCLLAIASAAVAASPTALDDLAGDYYFGDGLGVNCRMTVSKAGKFAFEWTGCLGTYDENKGAASIQGGILQLKPQKENRRQGFRGTATEFYPVRWGARMYLVPTNELVEFCNEVNQGTEPRREVHGQYYLRSADANKPASGKPAIPGEWSKYLLDHPVRGKIVELAGQQGAWLDKGSKDGLLEGMVLTAQPHGQTRFAQVLVEAVESDRCRIRCRWRNSELAVGQTVTSRFHE